MRYHLLSCYPLLLLFTCGASLYAQDTPELSTPDVPDPATWVAQYDIDTTQTLPLTATHILAEESQTYGFIDVDSNWIIPPVFTSLPYTFNPVAMGAKYRGKAYLIDGYGRPIIQKAYRSIYQPKEIASRGWFVAYHYKEPNALLDERGQEVTVIPNQAEFPLSIVQGNLLKFGARPFSQSYYYNLDTDRLLYPGSLMSLFQLYPDRYLIEHAGGSQLIDGEGEAVINGTFMELTRYPVGDPSGKNYHLVASSGTTAELYDLDGRKLYSGTVRYIKQAISGQPLYYITNTEGLTGLYDLAQATWVIPAEFERLRSSRGKVAVIASHQRLVGAFTLRGEPILPLRFRNVEAITPDLLLAEGDHQLARLYDLRGQLAQPAYYYEYRTVSPTLGRVRGFLGQTEDFTPRTVDGQRKAMSRQPAYALIDLRTGLRITPFLYTRVRKDASPKSSLNTTVERDGLRGTVDAFGNEQPGFRRITKE